MRACQSHGIVGQAGCRIQDGIAMVQMGRRWPRLAPAWAAETWPPRSFRVIAEVISTAVMRAM